MSDPSEEARNESLRVLNEGHQFPGQYMFKIIGENSPEFVARVLQATVTVVGPASPPNVSIRESTGGKHQAVTVSISVASAEIVLDVYAAIRTVAGVRFVL